MPKNYVKINKNGEWVPLRYAVLIYIYLSSITYHIKKRLPVNRSLSQPFLSRHPMERSAACQDKTAVRGTNCKSLRAQISGLLFRRERCLPTKELKKRCVTKQRTAAQKSTNKTNKIMFLYDKSSQKGLKRK